jgi:hypothetical protein
MEEFESYYPYFSIAEQNRLAEIKGITRDEYMVRLKAYEDYLENETVEQFEARLAATPLPEGWTDADTRHLLNKMSVNPQLDE